MADLYGRKGFYVQKKATRALVIRKTETETETQGEDQRERNERDRKVKQ